MTRRILALATLALLFSSCTKHGSGNTPQAGKTPEQVVRMFVEGSAGAKALEDRRHLQDLCSGEMARTFERMNDEAFRMIYMDGKVTIMDLKFMETREEGANAKVAYQLSVENKQGTDPTKEINTREVDLVKKDSVWFIENIRMRGTDQVAFTRGMLF